MHSCERVTYRISFKSGREAVVGFLQLAQEAIYSACAKICSSNFCFCPFCPLAMRAETGSDHMPITYAHQPQLQPQQVFILVPTDGDYATAAPHSTAPGAHAMSYAMALWPQLPVESSMGVGGAGGPGHPGGVGALTVVSEKQTSLSASSQNAPDPVPTPRTELPTESDEEKEPQRHEIRITASTARRLRRKRAAERVKIAQTRELSVPRLEDFRALVKDDPPAAIFRLTGHVWAWSQNDVGCRLVQEILELGTRDAAELALELRGHVLEAVMCPYANYVIQKVVSHLSTAASAFVAQELVSHAHASFEWLKLKNVGFFLHGFLNKKRMQMH